jgi:hypothetical protein
MKVIAKETDEKGKTILTIEQGIFKTKIKYMATSRIAGQFFTWVKLPNKTLVPDKLSFQLDEWKKDFD